MKLRNCCISLLLLAFKLAGPASPSTAPVLEFQSDISDANLYYWMASNAIDKNSNIAYTFSGGDASLTGCSGGPCQPSIYSAGLNSTNTLGTIKLAQAGSGSMLDTCNKHWGEYVSTSIDPSDDLTFWSVGEYLDNDISNCHAAEFGCTMSDFSGCGVVTGGTTYSWKTEAFTCQKGSGLCP